MLVRKSLNQALLQVGLGEGPFGSHVSMSVGVSKVSVPQEGFELGGAKKKKITRTGNPLFIKVFFVCPTNSVGRIRPLHENRLKQKGKYVCDGKRVYNDGVD